MENSFFNFCFFRCLNFFMAVFYTYFEWEYTRRANKNETKCWQTDVYRKKNKHCQREEEERERISLSEVWWKIRKLKKWKFMYERSFMWCDDAVDVVATQMKTVPLWKCGWIFSSALSCSLGCRWLSLFFLSLIQPVIISYLASSRHSTYQSGNMYMT